MYRVLFLCWPKRSYWVTHTGPPYERITAGTDGDVAFADAGGRAGKFRVFC